jgi:hypothetical protein
VATVLAGARVRQSIGTPVGQAQLIIQLAVSQQPGIGGDRGAAKLQQQTATEIRPQSAVVRFTRRVPHCPRKLLNFSAEPLQRRSKL